METYIQLCRHTTQVLFALFLFIGICKIVGSIVWFALGNDFEDNKKFIDYFNPCYYKENPFIVMFGYFIYIGLSFLVLMEFGFILYPIIIVTSIVLTSRHYHLSRKRMWEMLKE